MAQSTFRICRSTSSIRSFLDSYFPYCHQNLIVMQVPLLHEQHATMDILEPRHSSERCGQSPCNAHMCAHLPLRHQSITSFARNYLPQKVNPTRPNLPVDIDIPVAAFSPVLAVADSTTGARSDGSSRSRIRTRSLRLFSPGGGRAPSPAVLPLDIASAEQGKRNRL